MDGTLEEIYQENLEEDIIAYLAEKRGISLEDAMDEYYHSQLADKIHSGRYGVQYLDYRVLGEMVMAAENQVVE